jgi:hypothetical protein
VVLRARYRDVPCRGSQFFSDVRRWLAERLVRRVRRCVQVSGDRCILRGSRLRGRAPWAWVQRFRLREPRGRAVVRVGRRDGQVSAMFRAA